MRDESNNPAKPANVGRNADGLTRREFVAGGLVAAAALAGRDALAAGDPGATPVYRIHPAIGVARVGDADPATFFIGPEIPGYAPTGEAPGTAVPPYKSNGRIKPQAARFRVFEYATVNGRLAPVREVTLDTPGVVGIRWTAHVANRKASFRRFAGTAGEGSAPASFRNATVVDRRSLEIDFGPRTIDGRSMPAVEFRAGTSADPSQESYPVGVDGKPAIDYLGQLRTDAAGRLIFIGGRGRAAYNTAAPPPLASYANNDNWFDDVSDGPITATVIVSGGLGTREIPVDGAGGAWVLTGPPDFAPEINPTVNLYDLLFDLAVRAQPLPANHAFYAPGGPLASLAALKADFRPDQEVEFPTYVPDFTSDIQPILVNAYNFWWVTTLATSKHESLLDPQLGDPNPLYNRDRGLVFSYMRAPAGAVPAKVGKRSMPKLLGDDPYNSKAADWVHNLAMTRTQYGLMRRWSQGVFSVGGLPAPAITPHGLDRAALEHASGGAFFPGIEVSWQVRNPNLFIEPFRLNLAATSRYPGEEGQPIRAGHFSRQMALPWHADFNDCANEGSQGWWPAQRPDDVYIRALGKRVPWARADARFASGSQQSTHEDMVACWSKFGFIVRDVDAYVESERAPSVP